MCVNFPPPTTREAAAAARFSGITCNATTRAGSWWLWCSPLLLRTSLNGTTITHGYGQFSHSRVKINTSAIFFSFASSHSICTFPQRTGWKSFVPRNVFTSCPLTRLHRHSCTQTRTPTVYIPSFPLCRRSRSFLSDALPPLSLVEARLAQVSVAKSKQNKNVGCYLLFL